MLRDDFRAGADHELTHVAVEEIEQAVAHKKAISLSIHGLGLLRQQHKVKAREAALVQVRWKHADGGAEVLKALIADRIEVFEFLEVAAKLLVALRLDQDIELSGVGFNEALMGGLKGLIILRFMAARNKGLIFRLCFHYGRLLNLAE